ncbi:MAG: hypothetical protein PHY48_14520 [Candidatus Cloacimonetes bacterium]|nr:hypothetical protein [Candidatus Cloacimonadota bacterium]
MKSTYGILYYDFMRLANSLSALYPKGCDEKRLGDAMLLTVRSVT